MRSIVIAALIVGIFSNISLASAEQINKSVHIVSDTALPLVIQQPEARYALNSVSIAEELIEASKEAKLTSFGYDLFHTVDQTEKHSQLRVRGGLSKLAVSGHASVEVIVNW